MRVNGPRRGVTLIELLVTIVVAGGVLALVSAISLRQQRVIGDLMDRSALSVQLGDATSILAVDLAGASSAANDIREARDTSIELRATIASAVVCDTTGSRLILAPLRPGASTYASTLLPIEAGDTAWILSPTDSAEAWRPSPVTSVSSAAPGQCKNRGPLLDAVARAASRTVLTLGNMPANPVGVPIRFTRPTRYSLYRASDGQWYLGQREWNNGSQRFNGVQPVAGPFLPSTTSQPTFRYFDFSGAALASPVANRSSIALVRAEMRGQTKLAQRALGATVRRADSSVIWILLHNRR